MARVRYLVDDVDEAVAFYVSKLGFEVDKQFGPAIAILVRDDLELIVSGPKASAGRPMRDGAIPGPGEVTDDCSQRGAGGSTVPWGALECRNPGLLHNIVRAGLIPDQAAREATNPRGVADEFLETDRLIYHECFLRR